MRTRLTTGAARPLAYPPLTTEDGRHLTCDTAGIVDHLVVPEDQTRAAGKFRGIVASTVAEGHAGHRVEPTAVQANDQVDADVRIVDILEQCPPVDANRALTCTDGKFMRLLDLECVREFENGLHPVGHVPHSLFEGHTVAVGATLLESLTDVV